MQTIPNTNDGSSKEPSLKVYLNTGNLDDLRDDTSWSGATGIDRLIQLKSDGFDGIQQSITEPVFSEHPTLVCADARINTAQEADVIAAQHADRGYDCLTVHAGWGIEDEPELFGLVEAILKASEKYDLPIYIETHRATITQDIWRTVQICKHFPEARFNGDLSHYYCGLELVNGGLDMKLEFMSPIMDRIAFIHARVANPGNIQAPIGTAEGRPAFATGEVNYLDDFKTLWIRAMAGWLKTASLGDYFIFCPELLSAQYYYARKFPQPDGRWREESDRYAEALLYAEIGRECFRKAQVLNQSM